MLQGYHSLTSPHETQKKEVEGKGWLHVLLKWKFQLIDLSLSNENQIQAKTLNRPVGNWLSPQNYLRTTKLFDIM